MRVVIYSLMVARSTHITCAIMKHCATHAYLAVTSLTSWSNSMTALHEGEETAPLPTFLFITTAVAPRPSLLSLGVDLPCQVSCRELSYDEVGLGVEYRYDLREKVRE